VRGFRHQNQGVWGAPTVRAHGAGERNVAIGHPTDDGALTFAFPRGDPVYKQLVTTPGLRALITVDRAGGILGVKFRGRCDPHYQCLRLAMDRRQLGNGTTAR
jgi:hypothetical protein